MAYASAVALTVKEITRAGMSASEYRVVPTATHGNKIADNGRTFVRVVNGSAAPITVTLNANKVIDGLTVPNATVSVAATGDSDGLDDVLIGPFTPTFHQADGAYVWLTFSAVTDVLVGAFRI